MSPSAHSRYPGSAGLRRSVFVVACSAVVIGLGLHFRHPPATVAPRPPASSPPRLVLTGPRPAAIAPVAGKTDSTPAPPREVAAALALPAGPEHDAAFVAAIEPWILNDPAAASLWIVQITSAHDFDLAAALLVLHTDQLHRSTAVALTWAEDLADPALRLGALTHVLREWAQQNPDAPLRYIEHTPTLSSRDRAALRTALTPLPEET